MHHVFIVNPAAGKKSNATKFIPQIEEIFKSKEDPYTIYITKAPGDATSFAKSIAEKGEPVRFYAIGGDGTLLEVTSGVADYENAELAVVPCGSGNDYVKAYGGAEAFLNIEDLIEGTARKVDGIRCNDMLSLNICSIGMDADVCYYMSNFKKWPLVSGPLAYDLALIKVLFHPIGSQLKIRMETTEGIVEREGRYLFSLAANGQYYGGGYHGAPSASTNDGLLDFVMIKALPTLQAIKRVSGYKRGEHLDWDICEHYTGTVMEVECPGGAYVNIDGEIIKSDTIRFEVVPNKFNFVLPKSLIT